jgi:hypothetical protein
VVYNGGECDFNDDKTVLNIEGEAWSRWRRQKLEMKMVKRGYTKAFETFISNNQILYGYGLVI